MLEQVLARGADEYTSERLLELAEAYVELGRTADALDASIRAVEFCSKVQQLECFYALQQRAQIYLSLENESAALVDQTSALDVLEKIHSKLATSDFLKEEFHHLRESSYSLAIELEFRHGDFSRGLETAELARSRAFLDLLASHEMRQTNEQSRGSSNSSGYSGGVSSDAVILRGAKVAASSSDSERLQDLRSDVAAAPLTSNDISALAVRLRSTLLIYWVAENKIYIWVVTPDGKVHAQKVELLRSKLEELVRDTLGFGAEPGDVGSESSQGARSDKHATRRAPWRDLYDLLVRPVREWLPRAPGARLTIVPHGPLHSLSFAALQDSRGRYLVEDFALNYVPATSVLPFLSTRLKTDTRRGNLLLVADPTPFPARSGESQLPRLPGAREEAREIAQLVPRSRVTLLSGEAADETRVRQATSQQAVLHFATHAIVKDADPFQSFLALAQPRDNSNDGRLTAREIYDLHLDAGLVVLSACRSGEGRVTGDGIASLGRAFFYAGTPSVIVSLWDVADQPTNRLLPAFYRSWLRGADKAAALRSAQLQFLHDLRAGKVTISTPAGKIALAEDPAYWAGFVLLGEAN
jgi:CHAT domain-containing protein